VSGTFITDHQARLYMTHRRSHSQTISAAKVGISERSARRIEHQHHRPAKNQRKYRTRPDPLTDVWDEVVLPLLKSDQDNTAVSIFDHLCEAHLDRFKPGARRTLERRILQWRQLHGEGQAVVFVQVHPLGAQGICDFTQADFLVTIAGEPLNHKLFHYRLMASGWAFAQVTYGGESFAAFSDGLQNAFLAYGGVPIEVRTASLSAACKNHQEIFDFTDRFAELVNNYGFKPTRNKRGVAQENGAIESLNRHIKAQLKQALIIRGSHNFNDRDEYESFVQSIVDRRNRRVHDKFVSEQRQLLSLPKSTSVNYSEPFIHITRTSTVVLKRVTYTVPSRLVGIRVKVHLYDRRLDIYFGGIKTVELKRVFAIKGARGRCVNYKHVIGALVQKPRAVRHLQWRAELLPTEDYHRIWGYVDAELTPDKACI
jgi:hypothetical protein